MLGVAVFADLAYLAADDPHEGVVLVAVDAPVGKFAARFDFQRDQVAFSDGILHGHGQSVLQPACHPGEQLGDFFFRIPPGRREKLRLAGDPPGGVDAEQIDGARDVTRAEAGEEFSRGLLVVLRGHAGLPSVAGVAPASARAPARCTVTNASSSDSSAGMVELRAASSPLANNSARASCGADGRSALSSARTAASCVSKALSARSKRSPASWALCVNKSSA